ncbi:FecR family protein [Chitinophaga niabensis]|uniref:FecR family protein n=1 Tax=Chitinophaga niabensis TaxID=536979 RepID=UPI0031B9EA17
MEPDHNHIRQLYLQQLMDRLSEQEKLELEAAMEDPGIRQMCRDLDELYASPEMRELLRERPTSTRWNELMEVIMEREDEPVRYLTVRNLVAAATVLLVIGLGTWFLWVKPQQQFINYSAATEKAEKSYDIRLKLYSGEEVALTGPESNSSRLIGDVQLMSENKTLRYQQRPGGGSLWNSLEVPAKKDYKILLGDGTVVTLNSSSSLRFPFSFTGNTREVEVKGEAYFEVAKNAEKPFIVHTPNGDIRVLGTSFNVNTYEPGKTTTSLVEGSIKAVAGGKEVLLQPNQEASWKTGEPIVVQRFEASRALSWMDGVYFFEGANMKEIADVVDRWYDVKMVYDNPAIAEYKFDVKLDKSRPLEELLAVLKIAKGVNYRFEGNILHLQ